MSAPRGRGLRPGGIVRAVVRLVVMVALGFGIGLVFGLVTEEPELLGAHLRGESESIQLVDADAADETSAREAEAGTTILAANAGPDESPEHEAEQEPTVAGADEVYASAAVTTRPLVEPVERAATRNLPAVAAAESSQETTVSAAVAVPPSARAVARTARAWAIQVGAFSDEAAANRLAETLRDRYPVEVLPAKNEGGRFRVRVQPLDGESRARSIADDLKREERLPTWVTPVSERSR